MPLEAIPTTGWMNRLTKLYHFDGAEAIPDQARECMRIVAETAAEAKDWPTWVETCTGMATVPRMDSIGAALLRLVFEIVGWPNIWTPKSMDFQKYSVLMEMAFLEIGAFGKKLRAARAAKATGPLELQYTFTDPQQSALQKLLDGFNVAEERIKNFMPWADRPQNTEQWRVLDEQLAGMALVLAGSAGVGKSLTTFGMVLRLMEANPSITAVLLTAYTHVAAHVVYHYFNQQFQWMQDNGRLQVLRVDPGPGQKRSEGLWEFEVAGIRRQVSFPTTVMSGFKFINGLGDSDEDDDDGKSPFKRADRESVPWSLAVIDEASMVPIRQARTLLSNVPFPLLLVGDPGQLPPVEELQGQRDYFTRLVQAGFEERTAGFGNLMGAPNMRTDHESRGILELAYRIRSHVELPPSYHPEEPLGVQDTVRHSLQYLRESVGTPGVGTLREEGAIVEFVKAYTDPQRGSRHGAIITGTHRRREAMNKGVRNRLGYPEWGTLVPGERIVAECALTFFDSSGASASNNEILFVEEVSPSSRIPLSYTEPPVRNPDTGDESDVGASGLDPGEVVEFPDSLYEVASATLRAVDDTPILAKVSADALKQSPKNREWRRYTDALRDYKSRVYKKAGQIKHSKVHALIAMWSGVPYLDVPFPASRSSGLTSKDKLHYTLGSFGSFIPRYILRNQRMLALGSGGDPLEWEAAEVDAVREMVAVRQSKILLAHYGYSITGHASQGSQFPVVYLSADPPQMFGLREGDNAKGREAAQGVLKWLYVAATRAKSEIRVINPLPLATMLKSAGKKSPSPSSGPYIPPPPSAVPQDSPDDLLSQGLDGLV